MVQPDQCMAELLERGHARSCTHNKLSLRGPQEQTDEERLQEEDCLFGNYITGQTKLNTDGMSAAVVFPILTVTANR